MPRPDIFPEWAEQDLLDPITGQPNKIQPIPGFMNSGLNRGEPLIRQYVNYEYDKIVEWLKHYDDLNNFSANVNYIDNPIMAVQERPTSFTSSPAHFVTDRWYVGGPSTSSTSINLQNIPDLGLVPVGRVEKESSNALEFVQRVPHYHRFAGKTFTVSYYYRLENFDPMLEGMSGTGRIRTRIAGKKTDAGGELFIGDDNPSESPIITSSWRRHSFTFTVPDDATEIGGRTHLWVGVATLGDFSTSTDLVLETTAWKLEEGDTATPFIKPNEEEDLARCRYYYFKTYDRGVDPGDSSIDGRRGEFVVNASNFVRLNIPLPSMFTTPAITLYSPQTGSTGVIWNSFDNTDEAAEVTFQAEGRNSQIRLLLDASTTSNARYSAHLTADAEVV